MTLLCAARADRQVIDTINKTTAHEISFDQNFIVFTSLTLYCLICNLFDMNRTYIIGITFCQEKERGV